MTTGVTFGLNIHPTIAPPDDLVALARVAEDSNFDLIGVEDHPYRPDFYDTWTMITFLAANTRSVAFTPNVANLGLRPPTMLAKSAATLSALRPGRIRLGVGAGASGGPIPAMGGTERGGSDMVRYAEQSLHIVRTALRGGPVALRDGQFDIRGYEAGPPVTEPVEIWLGARARRMLGVVGRASDGWLSPISSWLRPSMVPGLTAVIDDAAEAAGRDPAAVRRIYNVAGVVRRPGRGDRAGSVEQWVERLVDWNQRLGFSGFVFWPQGDPAEQAALFGNEVVPRFHEALSAPTGSAADR
ncbi:MAG TPA: LLM class flavin-dependent oxidoreductase [Streptosporangiales bacterium]